MIKKYFDRLVHNNDEFNDYLNATLNQDKVIVSKKSASIGAFLIFIFGIADIISAVDNLEIFLVIRLFMTISCLMIVFLIYYHKSFFIEFYFFIISFVYLTTGFGILGMIYISETAGLVHTTYFAGLMLVIFAIFSLVYLNTSISLSISLSIILGYIVVYLLKTSPSDYTFTILLNNVMFLLATMVFGLLSDIIRKQYLFKNFISQKRLIKFLLPIHSKEAVHIDKETFLNKLQFQQSINDSIFDANTTNLNLILSTIKIDVIKNNNVEEQDLINDVLNVFFQQSNHQLKTYNDDKTSWSLSFTKDSLESFEDTLQANLRKHLKAYKNSIEVQVSVTKIENENNFEDQKIQTVKELRELNLKNNSTKMSLVT